jgi:hypothetical protein
MGRYLCLHGHIYQPPRENPWLEAVELQDSAFPYHDGNERITAECYAPIGLNLWKTRNLFFKLLKRVAPARREQAGRGDADAQEWQQHFNKLGDQRGFKENGMNS